MGVSFGFNAKARKSGTARFEAGEVLILYEWNHLDQGRQEQGQEKKLLVIGHFPFLICHFCFFDPGSND